MEDNNLNDHVRFVFELLDALLKPDFLDRHGTKDLKNIVLEHKRSNRFLFEKHGPRIIHFILYLNMDLDSCKWIRTDQSLNLHCYVHTKQITKKLYQKLVDILDLKSYMCETIMCTPYSFCADLVGVSLTTIKLSNKLLQLPATENLLVALLKCIIRAPIKPDLEGMLTSQFNLIMNVFNNSEEDDSTPTNQEEYKEWSKYNGFRIRSILKIYVEIINFKNIPDSYIMFPLYKLSSLRTSGVLPNIGIAMFNKFVDTIMHKCLKLCDFTIDNWLAWYEVEVIEEDTNLQNAIGHLCYELCGMIDKGYLDDCRIKDYRAILGNIAIEKINFRDCDIDNIDEMIERITTSRISHQNGWIKKFVENHDIFVSPQAIETLHNLINTVDYNCFKCVVDNCMRFYESGGVTSKSVGLLMYKGIFNLNKGEKLKILTHVVSNYTCIQFYFSNDFDDTLKYIIRKEFEPNVDLNELMSKLICLVIQQPRHMFHLLIAQYVTGICGFHPKDDYRKNFMYVVMAHLHSNMGRNYVFLEYVNWLDFNKDLSEVQKHNLRVWITDNLCFGIMEPKVFLVNVLMPLLQHPSEDFKHILYLIELVKFILSDRGVIRLINVDLWIRLVIQLAKILDDARWTMENYSTDRTELCEKIIQLLTILLNSANFLVYPSLLQNIKDEIADLHLLTRSHFLYLLPSDESENEMFDRFIMTTQSNHISFSNVNRSSSQQIQEEFIFSIATYMPRFTMYEMQKFIENYFDKAQNTDIQDAAFFLFDCVLNAFMRIIVYMKTAIQNNLSNNIKAWDYLDNAIVNFLDCANNSCVKAIYDFPEKELAFFTSTKILMVLKQMDDSHQAPLLVVLRRLINATIENLNKENVSKLLSMILVIKTTNCTEILKTTTENLVEKLKTL